MSKTRWIGLCLIIFGTFIFSYYFEGWYSARKSAETLTSKEIQQYKTRMPIENKGQIHQTYEEPVQTKATEVKHRLGNKIAYLIIPKTHKKYSVYWGTDDNVLKKGVGMFVSDLTTTPTGNGHTVLSGHRDTVFSWLNQLKENDQLIVEYENKSYSYSISKHWITNAEDRTVIVQKEKPTLTLTTCYPFNYIGDAPERYIIEASLISVSSAPH